MALLPLNLPLLHSPRTIISLARACLDAVIGNLASESFQALGGALARLRACVRACTTLHLYICIYNVDCHPTPKLGARARDSRRVHFSAAFACSLGRLRGGKSLLLKYYTTDELLQTKSFNLIFHNTFVCECVRRVGHGCGGCVLC